MLLVELKWCDTILLDCHCVFLSSLAFFTRHDKLKPFFTTLPRGKPVSLDNIRRWDWHGIDSYGFYKYWCKYFDVALFHQVIFLCHVFLGSIFINSFFIVKRLFKMKKKAFSLSITFSNRKESCNFIFIYQSNILQSTDTFEVKKKNW